MSGLSAHNQSIHYTVEKRKEENLPSWCHSCWLTQLAHNSIYRHNKLCHICLADKNGTTPRRMLQKTFLGAVKEKFQKDHPGMLYLPQTEDKRFFGGKACGVTKRQPDQGWRIGPLANGRYRFIDGELDEDSHRSGGYTTDCEVGKMFDTNFGVECGEDEVIFLRVGLDYRHTMKEFNNAVASYVTRLVYWLCRESPCEELYIGKYPAKVGVEYLNYGNRVNIDSAEMDTNVVVLK